MDRLLENKTVILGVSASIAAYKAAELVSALKKKGADVHVIMTKNALHFMDPLTFETLSGNRCITDTFDRSHPYEVDHIALSKRADVAMVAPASADIIGKMAHGIADDMLTTTLLACTCPVLVAPAMNTAMYRHKAVQCNLERLTSFGYRIIEPVTGLLACGDTGEGKMEEPEMLLEQILYEIALDKDMKGKRVLVTAGPTTEAIDPVRFISNHSSGKMGYALARNAAMRGAEVLLVSGRTNLNPPLHVKTTGVMSAAEMAGAVKDAFQDADIVIKAAAVADMRPKQTGTKKLKKTAMESALELEGTEDILAWCGAHKNKKQFICGFAMETEDLVKNAREKLSKKNADMIVANSLSSEGAGFRTDTNVVTIITKKGEKQLPLLTKDAVAHEILTEILNLC